MSHEHSGEHSSSETLTDAVIRHAHEIGKAFTNLLVSVPTLIFGWLEGMLGIPTNHTGQSEHSNH